MSNKNTITHAAAAIADLEAALEATRQAHAGTANTHIEAKITALAEVVRNTHRKMAFPAGFEWALHHSFKIISIDRVHISVEASRGGNRVRLDIPRSDLSLSTWQVTSIIRRKSAERLLGDLNATAATKRNDVVKNRREVTAAQERLKKSERALEEAQAVADRRLARNRSIEAKRAAARERRSVRKNGPALVAAAAQ